MPHFNVTPPVTNVPTPFREIRRFGFTIIELLTVILIVAVIVSIMIPVISTVREQAHTSQCSSKIRNLGQAILLYQANNGGYLPPNCADSSATRDNTWTMVMRPYLDVNDMRTYGTADEQMAERLSCPALDSDLQPSRWWTTNYAVGMAFGTDGVRRKPVELDPTRAVMLGENQQPNVRSMRYTNGPWSYIGFNHSGTANIVFYDGHLERWTSEECPRTYDDPAWAAE